ncbi:hypothetical protein [Planotetraspora sp. GP83]|uniref:hypothetical protein n=1 Tax=Planotetraspora sp. GP83 TaxID=3156264 RepID=UPI00351164F3
MPCKCQERNRTQYEVVQHEKVVYTSTSEPTAKAVAKRYPGSEVRPKGGQADAQQAAQETATA